MGKLTIEVSREMKRETGCMIWTPPPGTALMAFEELRNVRLKRQESMHVIIVPKLMKLEWLKQLQNVTDTVMVVPARLDCWDP